MKGRNLKYILMSIFCIAIASTLGVAFCCCQIQITSDKKSKALQEHPGYDDVWVDIYNGDEDQYHFGDFGRIHDFVVNVDAHLNLENYVSRSLESLVNEKYNQNYEQDISDETLIEDENCTIQIGGITWRAASIFTTSYDGEDADENTYELSGDGTRFVVTFVAPEIYVPESDYIYPFSRYHLAGSDSPKSVRYNEYYLNDPVVADGAVIAYVSAYTLGDGGKYFGELSKSGDDDEFVSVYSVDPYYGAWYALNVTREEVRGFDLSLFNFGGMRRFIYGYNTPGLMTPQQYLDWQEYFHLEYPCLLQTYTETLESDIQNYAPDYYDEYLELVGEKPEVANRTILLGVDDKVVPAMYAKEEIGDPGPGGPGDMAGREVYAYDNEYIVVPCMQLDIAKTYVAAATEGDANYLRPGAAEEDLDIKITLDYNDDTGHTGMLTLHNGEWPDYLGAPFNRFGYKFIGWYSEKVGGYQVYDENGKFHAAAYYTIYARWILSNWEDWAADSYAGGLGTKQSPYQIETAAQLAKLSIDRDTEGKYYVQTSDISLSAYPWRGIGSHLPFEGNYDGQNFAIYYMKCLNNQETGLFTYASNATIKNVHIKSGTINTNDGRATGLVAIADNVTIENCTNWVNCSSASGTASGGIVADLSGTSTIRSCINYGDIYSVSQYAGWLGNAGGIVGRCSGDVTIEDCINMGNVTATMEAGGIIGKISGSGKTFNVISCSSLGNLKSTGTTRFPGPYDSNTYSPGAGLVGFASLSDTTKEDSTLNITACSIIGEISVAEGEISPFCGCCAAEREEFEDEYGNVYHHNLNQVLTASYAYVNGMGYYTTALSDANWAKYWTIVPAINSNATLKRCLPVKKAFLKYFWMADVVDTTKPTTQAEFAAAFSGFTLLS